eukprot:ctg_940.g404
MSWHSDLRDEVLGSSSGTWKAGTAVTGTTTTPSSVESTPVGALRQPPFLAAPTTQTRRYSESSGTSHSFNSSATSGDNSGCSSFGQIAVEHECDVAEAALSASDRAVRESGSRRMSLRQQAESAYGFFGAAAAAAVRARERRTSERKAAESTAANIEQPRGAEVEMDHQAQPVPQLPEHSGVILRCALCGRVGAPKETEAASLSSDNAAVKLQRARLWSAATLGTNTPNEDAWSVEVNRLLDRGTDRSSVRGADNGKAPAGHGIVESGGGQAAPSMGRARSPSPEAADTAEALSDAASDSFTVGVYDGHEGRTCCDLVRGRLHQRLRQCCGLDGSHSRFLQQHGVERLLAAVREAFEATDADVLDHLWQRLIESRDGHYAITGTCCLSATVLNDGRDLVVASLGDCEAFIGRRQAAEHQATASGDVPPQCLPVRVGVSHNLRLPHNLQAMRARFPDDPQVVQVIGENAYVKGKLQVSHAFGNGYLKRQPFNDQLYPIFRARSPYQGEYVSARPSTQHYRLSDADEFLILGTDGFWDHVDATLAVALVGGCCSSGKDATFGASGMDRCRAARYLLHTFVRNVRQIMREESSQGQESHSPSKLRSSPSGMRALKDDATVMVVFLRPDWVCCACVDAAYTANDSEEESDDSPRITRSMSPAGVQTCEAFDLSRTSIFIEEGARQHMERIERSFSEARSSSDDTGK